MENLNRLKAVLADFGKTNKWVAEQFVKPLLALASGVQIRHNLIYILCQEYRIC